MGDSAARKSRQGAAARESEALERLTEESGEPGETFRWGEDPDQLAEIFAPDNDDDARPAPTVVVVHGGYFRPQTDRAHARPVARALTNAGYRVVLAEYRRTPGAPGESIDDLRGLDRALRNAGTRPAAWIGHSAGGALALIRTQDESLPPVPVLALAAVSDFEHAIERRLGSNAVLDWVGEHDWTALNPQRLLVAGVRAPVLLLHGDDDVAVPVEQSRRTSSLAGVPFTELTGAHHFDLVDPESPYWPRVVEALDGLIADSGRTA